MPSPFTDLVNSLGTCQHWHRFHEVDAATEDDVGVHATNYNLGFGSGVGTYLSQQSGPLAGGDTTYSVQFIDGYLYQNSNDFDSKIFGGVTTSGSVSFFFKTSSTTRGFIQSCHPSNNAWNISMHTDGSIGFQLIQGANSREIITDVDGLYDNQWHYFFLTCDGVNPNRMFIDGYETSYTILTGGTGFTPYAWLNVFPTSPNPLDFLYYGNNERHDRAFAIIDLPFIGYLSEFGYWSGAVSPSDILALWEAAQGIPEVINPGGTRRSFRKTYA